jgi:hypothetical protein
MSKTRKASTVSNAQPQDETVVVSGDEPQVDESLLPNDDEPDLSEFENQTIQATPQEAIEATNADASGDTVATEAKPKTKKDPVPEGFEPPVAFTKRMNEEFANELGGTEMKPQVMYGYLKQSSDFPKRQNTDGRWLVNIEKGRTWFRNLLSRRAERAAKKAAAPATNGEAAQEAETSAEPSNAS